MSSMRILRPLPDAPTPTKPMHVKEVQGIRPEHLEVRPYRPPVVVASKPKHKKPTWAIKESARRKAEERERRKEEAIRMWRAGVPFDEIAERLGVNTCSVYDYTRDLRVAKRDAEMTRHDEAVIRMYEEGRTYQQMADELGIKKRDICNIVQRLHKYGKIKWRRVWSVR